MKLQQSFPSILPMAAPQCARMFNSFAICDLVLLPLCAPLCVCVYVRGCLPVFTLLRQPSGIQIEVKRLTAAAFGKRFAGGVCNSTLFRFAFLLFFAFWCNRNGESIQLLLPVRMEQNGSSFQFHFF